MTDQKALSSDSVEKPKVPVVDADIQTRQIRLGLAIMDRYAATYEILEAAERVLTEHEQVIKELHR